MVATCMVSEGTGEKLRVEKVHVRDRLSNYLFHPNTHRTRYVHTQSPHLRDFQSLLFDPAQLHDLFLGQLCLQWGVRCLYVSQSTSLAGSSAHSPTE